MRYVIATGAGLFVFLIVGLAQGALIGQMFGGVRSPNGIEITILYVGQLAIPCAAATWAFSRITKNWRRAGS